MSQPATQAMDSQADQHHVTQLTLNPSPPLESQPQTIHPVQPPATLSMATELFPTVQPKPSPAPAIQHEKNDDEDATHRGVEEPTHAMQHGQKVRKLSMQEGERPSKRQSPCVSAPPLCAGPVPIPCEPSRRPSSAAAPPVSTPTPPPTTQACPATLPISPLPCTPPNLIAQENPELQGTLKSVSGLLDTLACPPAADDADLQETGAAPSLAALLSSGGTFAVVIVLSPFKTKDLAPM